MNNSLIQIRPFALRSASQADYYAQNAFDNLMRAEALPDDPPIPDQEAIQSWQNIPPFVDIQQWSAWDGDRSTIVASAWVAVLRMENNQHLAQFRIEVAPEARRQGLARRLLALVVAVAQSEERRLLITDTNGRVAAGEAFMNRLGAQRGQEGHTNQLVLADLDHALLPRWLAQGAQQADAFELGFWLGPYPAAYLDAIAALTDVMNTAPRDQLEVEDFHMTPEQLRQYEQSLQATGTERWTVYVIERATGQFAGFSEVFWNANRPTILGQGGTGVFPAYRNRGLGRWLKAVMLEKVLHERPAVKFIRTGNADSNAAMLKINQELGFTPYMSHCIWQVETAQAATYLNQRNG
jgi:GNAT superfamily N-acetyltransferase